MRIVLKGILGNSYWGDAYWGNAYWGECLLGNAYWGMVIGKMLIRGLILGIVTCGNRCLWQEIILGGLYFV